LPGKAFLQVEPGPLLAAPQERLALRAEDKEGVKLLGPVQVRIVRLFLDPPGVLHEGRETTRSQRILPEAGGAVQHFVSYLPVLDRSDTTDQGHGASLPQPNLARLDRYHVSGCFAGHDLPSLRIVV
jgi:hypothetical protein